MATHPKSKKWVDYSDSDSPDEFSPAENPKSPPTKQKKIDNNPPPMPLKRYCPSKTEVNQALDLLDDLDDLKVEQVWLQMYSQNRDFLQKQMQFLSGKARKGGNIVRVNSTQDPELFQVLVYIDLAYDYVKKGYDPDDYIKVTVANRNFERGSRNGRQEKPERPKKYVRKQGSAKYGSKQQKYLEKKEQNLTKKQQLKQTKDKFIEKQSVKEKEEEKPSKKEVKEVKKKKQVGSKYASKNPFEGLQDL